MSSADPMHCPRCDAAYGADFEFCPRDGCRLESTAAPFSDPLIGSVVDGRYRVVGVLGRGGSGTVYRAEQLTVDRPVALKVIAADAASEAHKVKRFEQEARTLSRLRHPNTVKLIDFGRLPDGRPFIANMLLQGRSLAEVLASERTVSIGRTLTIMRAVCDALTEAHAEGVVHRDLKTREHLPRDRRGARGGQGHRLRRRAPARPGRQAHRGRHLDGHRGVHVARADPR